MEQPDGLSRWTAEHLGSGVAHVLWEAGHLSWVGAVALRDDRVAVIKARPWRDALVGCYEAHRQAWQAGFPCPEPLTGPIVLSPLAVSAEAHLPGGAPGRGDDPTLAERTATALAWLMAVLPEPSAIPSIDPPPPWTGWSDPLAQPWPPPDEGPPLNDRPETESLRTLAAALNERLRDPGVVDRVGHADWYQGNLRWRGDELLAADDWDSLARLPKAAIAGCAAASFRPGIPGVNPDTWPGAELSDTEEFLASYQRATGRPFSSEEVEIAWAAGLWQRVFDAAKAVVDGRPNDAADKMRDASRRARLAGISG